MNPEPPVKPLFNTALARRSDGAQPPLGDPMIVGAAIRPGIPIEAFLQGASPGRGVIPHAAPSATGFSPFQ